MVGATEGIGSPDLSWMWMTLPSVWGIDGEGSPSVNRAPQGGWGLSPGVVAVPRPQNEKRGSVDVFEVRISNNCPATLK